MTTQVALRPISDHIVVRRADSIEATPGGIVLPDQAKDKPTRGKVVAVGSGPLLRDGSRAAMEIVEGDSVVFAAFSGTEVEIEGETFVVIRESEVLLVL